MCGSGRHPHRGSHRELAELLFLTGLNSLILGCGVPFSADRPYATQGPRENLVKGGGGKARVRRTGLIDGSGSPRLNRRGKLVGAFYGRGYLGASLCWISQPISQHATAKPSSSPMRLS